MRELSPRVATPFRRMGIVNWLACIVSGLGFAFLTSCSNAPAGNSRDSSSDDRGSVTNPDSMVGNPDRTASPPDGAVGDGTTDRDGGSSSTTPDAGSDGPLNPASCPAVPVPVASGGRELHVATTGNDGNADGSATRPYASLSAAVRSAVAADTVLVHGGTYALTSAQVLNPAGRAGSPITIRAVAGDTVVFDGAGVQFGNYDGLIRISGSYAVVDGFEVVNSRGGGIQLVAANQVMVRRCRIHNIAFQALGGSGNDIVLQQNEVGTITVDGGTYDILTHTQVNQPAITGGTATFVQFWSLRTEARQCGHISISEHFKAWANAGLILGNMEEAKILVEVGGGIGSIDFTSATLTAQ